VDIHDRLVLLTAAPTLHRADWGKDPSLELGFNPVLERIWFLAKNGLTSRMVLHDYKSKCITPLQARTRPAWVYTGVNDTTRLERGAGSCLDDGALALSLMKLTPNPFSVDFITPPAVCQPICLG
jgi:hypothetical protein